MTPTAIIIAQLIVQYGISGAIQIIQIINKTSITDEDIAALRDIKPPESFFIIPISIPVPKPIPIPIPEPVPVPVTKPTSSFPVFPFGPKPTDKDGLTSYLSRYISDPIVKVWIDWLAANPQDLDWVWSEYIKVNG